LGVFVLSLVSMTGGSIVATVGWMAVSQIKQHPVEITDEIALFIHSSIFTLLGLLGVFGFVGSLVKSRAMVIAFSVGLAIHLGLSIGSGIFTIYSIFKESSAEAVQKCLDGKTDEETLQICKTGMNVVKGVMVAIYVIAWLIELYAYFIVERYANQLEDEEIARLTPIMPQNVNQQPMMYTGYPQRFSYSHYAESRRSYMPPLNKEGGVDHSQWDQNHNGNDQFNGTQFNGPDNNGQLPFDQQQRDGQHEYTHRRPQSESYAFSLPQQAYGVTRGKDASNLA